MKRINTLLISVLLCSALFLSGCNTTSSLFSDAYPKATKSSPVVNTNYGPVQGITLENTNVDFYGAIPYAKPPVGELRWKAPVECDKWQEVRDCNYFPPMAPQNVWGKFMTWVSHKVLNTDWDRTDGAPMSEDCLYLSIWAPSKDNAYVENPSKIPVLVYIHGGYLKGGQGWYEAYDGESFARDGVIVVNIEYRVGIFGFFTDSELEAESPVKCSGNYGIMDQIAALKWVKENIKYFGGDANNITICGESAGSTSVSAICCSPLSKGLFRRAIGESSSVVGKNPPHTFYTKEQINQISSDVKAELGVETLAQMRELSMEQLLKFTDRFAGLTIDGYVLTELPYETYSKGNNHEEALLNGFNLNEAELLSLFTKKTPETYMELLTKNHGKNAQAIFDIENPTTKKQAFGAYNNYATALWFGYQHDVWTQLSIQNKTPVYYYLFTRDNDSYGNSHFGEMFYAFGTIPEKSKAYEKYDYELERIMHGYWLNFIKTGNPNGENLPVWEQANKTYPQVFELGDNVGPINNPFAKYFFYISQGKVE